MKSGAGKEQRSERAAARPASSRPSSRPTAAPELERLLREGLRSLVLDERMERWAAAGSVPYPLPAGEWGPALAAVGLALEERDWLFPGLREARGALSRGMPLEAYLAQILGRSLGQGSVVSSPGEIADAAHRVASVAGGPASHLPHAVGAALAARLRRKDEVALALCGEAAVAEPDFHVACNFAGVYRAPLLLGVRLEAGSDFDVEARAAAYGIAGVRLDPGDLEPFLAALRALVGRVRGGSPTLLALAHPVDPEAAVAQLAGRIGADVAALRAEAGVACDAAFEAAGRGSAASLEDLARHVFAGPERHLGAELRELTERPERLDQEI